MLYIFPLEFYIFIPYFSLFLSFVKFQHIFNNAEHTISRLSLWSILLIFYFKSVALFLSLSLFFSFSLAFPFSIFSLICRDKAIRRVNITSRKIQPQTTLEFHRFVVNCTYTLSQRKYDVRGLTRFFFFHQFLQCARSIMYLPLNLQDEVIVELPINQIDPLLRMKG